MLRTLLDSEAPDESMREAIEELIELLQRERIGAETFIDLLGCFLRDGVVMNLWTKPVDD